jgi:hypothetical protein
VYFIASRRNDSNELAARVTKSSKIFLAHVLAVMLLADPDSTKGGQEGTHKSEEENKEEGKDDGRFQVFNIGPRIADKNEFSVERLREYASAIAVPTQFLKMLDTARDNKEYILAAFALADPPDERFYIFGLFKKAEDTASPALVPVKVIEVTGVDGFVLKENRCQ